MNAAAPECKVSRMKGAMPALILSFSRAVPGAFKIRVEPLGGEKRRKVAAAFGYRIAFPAGAKNFRLPKNRFAKRVSPLTLSSEGGNLWLANPFSFRVENSAPALEPEKLPARGGGAGIPPKRVFKRAKKPLSAERGTSAENIFYRTARNRRIRTRPQPESGGHSEMRPNHARKEPPARAIHCRRRMGRILRNAEIRGGQISVFRGKRACLPFTDVPKDMLNPRRQKNCRI